MVRHGTRLTRSLISMDTPLKLADYFNIPGVFVLNGIKDSPPSGPVVLGTSVYDTSLHDYVYGAGQWNSTLRKKYNLEDATTRNTVQVNPNSWSAILISIDNKGMWNLRSSIWSRRYLGQELYVRVWNNEKVLTLSMIFQIMHYSVARPRSSFKAIPRYVILFFIFYFSL